MLKIISSFRIKRKFSYYSSKILGIQLLRVILSFMVIIDNLCKRDIKKYNFILYYHIPTFFIISFYFTYKTFISYDIKKTKLRLERLFIPYIIWSFISWILKYFEIKNIKFLYSLKIFIIHLINGHMFNYSLWFQNILILITISFIIIVYLFKRNCLKAFVFIYIICYILQYSEINYKFFSNNFTINSSATFGRFVEAFPNAISGFYLSYINIIPIVKKNKKIILFFNILFLLITIFHKFDKFHNFKYGGIRLNLAGISIFIFFSYLPLENLRNKILIKIFLLITSHTGGIYFIHRLIGNGYLFSKLFPSIKGTFSGCIIVYLISFLISFTGNKMLKNTKLKHIFA